MSIEPIQTFLARQILIRVTEVRKQGDMQIYWHLCGGSNLQGGQSQMQSEKQLQLQAMPGRHGWV